MKEKSYKEDEVMQRKITFDIVKQEFDERGYELVSTYYPGYSEKLQYVCPKHKDKGIQEITFANFTKGRGCPYCAHRKKRTTAEYKQELTEIAPNITVLEDYCGLKEKFLHRCNDCGYEWKVVPTNLLHLKQGCPRCHKRHYVRTQEEFEAEIMKIHPNIKVLGEFTKVATKISFGCMKCGMVWEAKPNNILNGQGCPNCKISYGERQIANWLKEHNIYFISQYCFEDCINILSLPFDFYIPDRNMCVEYDGLQHYKPCRFGGISLEEAQRKLVECQKRDKIKTNYCNSHNINLLRISYKEYNNITQILSLNFN